MFHSAFDFRDRFVTGWMPRPSGVGSEKPWMPCLKGRLPVAIDVHSIGDSGGCRVAIWPHGAVFDEPLDVGHFAGIHERMDDLPIGRIPSDQQNFTRGPSRVAARTGTHSDYTARSDGSNNTKRFIQSGGDCSYNL